MELTHQDVLEILELLEHSNVEYLELQIGDTKLVASRHGSEAMPREVSAVPGGGAPAAASPVVSDPEGAPAAGPPQGGGHAVAQDAADLVTVVAPVVGVFYRGPEPGAAPFVEVGSQVDEDTTLGLIELMKTFNSVSAGVRGDVSQILAGNDEFVEFGQPLVLIRPETAR